MSIILDPFVIFEAQSIISSTKIFLTKKSSHIIKTLFGFWKPQSLDRKSQKLILQKRNYLCKWASAHGEGCLWEIEEWIWGLSWWNLERDWGSPLFPNSCASIIGEVAGIESLHQTLRLCYFVMVEIVGGRRRRQVKLIWWWQVVKPWSMTVYGETTWRWRVTIERDGTWVQFGSPALFLTF